MKSVVPDMKQMNDNQRRRFKIEILTVAERILTETSESTLPCSNENNNGDSNSMAEMETVTRNSDLNNLGEFLRFT